METGLVAFQDRAIRRIRHDGEWYFSVVDIVRVLTDSADAKDYWYRLKKREAESGGIELSTFCRQLKLASADGKFYETDCVNTKNAFRLIQSIPSKKAEPFKLWLAQVGYERVKEIEDPELAGKRMGELYRRKGYSDAWIAKRLGTIATRDELTDEWKRRKIGKEEYAILTAEISKAAFGMTPAEYKRLKGLKTENLRDHMDDLELIFTMLGEASTTRIAQVKDAQGFARNEEAAKKGGGVAGTARRALETEIGERVAKRGKHVLRR